VLEEIEIVASCGFILAKYHIYICNALWCNVFMFGRCTWNAV